MEIEILKEGKNLLEFKMKGERHTFANLLKERILEDSNVTFAAYKLEHPLLNEAMFIVRTKDKPAKKVLLDANKLIEEELGEFEKSLKKAMKK